MFLEIITPDKTVYSGLVSAVKVPGTKGSFEVLNGHAPIISTLVNGKVRVKDKDGVHFFKVKGGVIEVLKDKVILLAESV